MIVAERVMNIQMPDLELKMKNGCCLYMVYVVKMSRDGYHGVKLDRS